MVKFHKSSNELWDGNVFSARMNRLMGYKHWIIFGINRLLVLTRAEDLTSFLLEFGQPDEMVVVTKRP